MVRSPESIPGNKKHISTAAEATLLSNLSTLDSNSKLRPQLTIELGRSYQALNQHHPTNQLRTILPYVTPDLSRLGPSNMSMLEMVNQKWFTIKQLDVIIGFAALGNHHTYCTVQVAKLRQYFGGKTL